MAVKPAPLTAFVARLLKSQEVRKLVADHYGPAAAERMKQFRSGEVGELLDLIEDNKWELSKVVDTEKGAAPDDDTFSIEIRAFGSVYWIEANEFDDIGYFASSTDAYFYAIRNFGDFINELAEREEVEEEEEEKRERTPSRPRDEVVTAVLSRGSNAAHLVTQFTAAVGDPLAFEGEEGFPEIASGGFVWRRDLRKEYEVYDEVWPLEGRVSKSRTKAFEGGAALTSAEKALYSKRKLAKFFAEPADGAGYIVVAVTSSSGRTAYWTEIRKGNAREGIEREVLGIFPSLRAAKASLRRKGLISARDYRSRRRAR